MANIRALGLTENHRRGITTTLRLLDQALCGVCQWAEGREVRSVFYQESNRLTATQRENILATVSSMQEKLLHIREDLQLEPHVQSVADSIRGQCLILWTSLVELESGRLARYGKIPAELPDYLDPKNKVLVEHLKGIMETL
ncbi:MAG: hypothetical protein JRJ12_04705 [Deltaproteobacteria bacterium]|nr:hypothetical protein [Deltaproteobacteria bacterium]MBW2070442.1 hypothetical protein [Deltaproteobacteria bacterium]